MSPSATGFDTRPALAWRQDLDTDTSALSSKKRAVPEETPVALSYNGSTYAVMLASPSDLEDFAVGFSLSEDIIKQPSDIENIEIIEVNDGFDARIWLKPTPALDHWQKRRNIAGPTGCGLCGVESIDAVLKALPVVSSKLTIEPDQIFQAFTALHTAQTLNQYTHAVHAAALWHAAADNSHGLMFAREDVGRHNALDKVVGAAARAAFSAQHSIVLLTSRVSVELVQKTARLGAPVIAAVSAPTTLAIRMAEAANITLIAVVRHDGFEVFTHNNRVANILIGDHDQTQRMPKEMINHAG